LKKRLIIGLIISLIFLYLAIRQIDFSLVKDAFAKADYLWGIPTAAAIIFTMWLRALRWRYLMLGMKSIRNSSLFSSVMIGFMANNILPARLGELVRAVSIAKKESISRSGSFATIMVERIFDSFMILFMMGLCLIIFPFPYLVRKAGYMAFIVNFLALIVLFALSRWPIKTKGIIQLVAHFLPHKIGSFTLRLMDRFVDGLGVFHSGKSVFMVSLYTIAIWIITALSNYFIFLALDLRPPLIATFVVLVIVALAVMLPASPGFIGTFQYGCMVALGLFGYPKEIAFPFSVILWACQYFPVTLLGLYYLRKEAFSLKKVSEESVV